MRPLARLAPLLALLACRAPGPAGAEVYCDQRAACDCAPLADDGLACLDHVAAREADLRALADADGLAFDEACWDARLRELGERLGCALSFSDLADALPLAGCAPVHGDLPRDAACEAREGPVGDGAVRYSACAGDLVCHDDRCLPRRVTYELGEPCRNPSGSDIVYTYPCRDGLACSVVSRTCVRPGADGEPCGGGDRCASGLACDPATSRCGPPPGLGEPCLDACAGDLVCSYGEGRCAAAPALGEPCQLAEPCREGAFCDGAVCRAEPPAICFEPPETSLYTTPLL